MKNMKKKDKEVNQTIKDHQILKISVFTWANHLIKELESI